MNITSDLENKKLEFHQHVLDLQNQILAAIKSVDPEARFEIDPWERLDHEKKPGGGGITCSITGSVIENAGVNTSRIFGAIDPDFMNKLGGTKNLLWAAGISLIIHPKNPKVPTVHANFRMIDVGNKFWFGGGADLTPFYPYPEDFQHFHQTWKNALATYGDNYQSMKKVCDQYFVNTHRDNEMRGIGGIFFDHFFSGNLEADFQMVKKLSEQFIQSYFPIVEKRKNEPYTAEDEDFQLHRRGRYVEFNLLHDRGTMFGLKTNGRTDSILISLPARAKFSYKYQPRPNSPQAEMMKYYQLT